MFGKKKKGSLKQQLISNKEKSLDVTRKAIRDRLVLAAEEGKNCTYFYTKEFPYDLVIMVAEEEGLEAVYVDQEDPILMMVGW